MKALLHSNKLILNLDINTARFPLHKQTYFIEFSITEVGFA